MVAITVKYFAGARERAGVDQERLELPATTDTVAIAAALGERHPDLARLLVYSRIAVRQAFAKGAVDLHDGDEIAVIPPVSGG